MLVDQSTWIDYAGILFIVSQSTQINRLVCWQVSQPRQIGWYASLSVNLYSHADMLVGLSIWTIRLVTVFVGQSTRIDRLVCLSMSKLKYIGRQISIQVNQSVLCAFFIKCLGLSEPKVKFSFCPVKISSSFRHQALVNLS